MEFSAFLLCGGTAERSGTAESLCLWSREDGMELSDVFSRAAIIVLGALAGYIVFKILVSFTGFVRHLKKRDNKGQTQGLLEKALQGDENFEIRTRDKTTSQEYPAMLHGVDKLSLKFRVYAEFPQKWKNQLVEVFFSIPSLVSPGRKDFYKFKCTVLSVERHENISFIRTSAPASLESGQKRNFFRVAPLPNTVKMLAMWILPSKSDLPRNTADIGNPRVSSREGDNSRNIKIYDISASGVGLEVNESVNDEQLQVNSQILCLIIFNESIHSGERLVNFFASGKITNIRPAVDDKSNNIMGIEFTNWSILQRDSKTINWFQIKKGNGVSPILQWISKMEKSRQSHV